MARVVLIEDEPNCAKSSSTTSRRRVTGPFCGDRRGRPSPRARDPARHRPARSHVARPLGHHRVTALKREPRTQEIPIIMVTAKGEEVDRIVGLELGADDYLVKPFSVRELVLRMNAVLRRGDAKEPPLLEVAELRIDRDAHRVEVPARRSR